jgi:spermidine synthase
MNDFPEVNISEDGEVRYLHLDTPWVQGSMLMAKPFDIHLEYVQRMMAGLLWQSALKPAEFSQLRCMQLGLGAASLTKFCLKRLNAPTCAVEINPQVILACKRWFRLDDTDANLVICPGDAEKMIQNPRWAHSVDLLHVDLYDHDAAAPVLDTTAFYVDCAKLLSTQGVMAVNLFGRNATFAQSLSRIVAAFADGQVWAFRPTREGNTVVLASTQAQRPAADAFAQAANAIEQHLKLPARKWVQALQLQWPNA